MSLKLESLKNKNYLKKIANAVYTVLEQKEELKAEIVFVGLDEIHELNKRTRKVDRPTDVLSFPTLDGIRNKVIYKKDYPTEVDEDRLFIGSIVLCNDKIKAQAKEYGHSKKRERNYLIIHGLLHLFGFDHMEEKDKKEMRDKEKAVLSLLGILDV